MTRDRLATKVFSVLCSVAVFEMKPYENGKPVCSFSAGFDE